MSRLIEDIITAILAIGFVTVVVWYVVWGYGILIASSRF